MTNRDPAVANGIKGPTGPAGAGYLFEEYLGGPPPTPILVSSLTVGDSVDLYGRVGAYKVGDLVKVTESGKDPEDLYIIGRVTGFFLTGDYAEKLEIEVVEFKFGTETLIGEDTRPTVSLTGADGGWSTSQTLRSVTASTDTPTSSDNGKLVTVDTTSGAVTITINGSLDLPVGGRIDFAWIGAATAVSFTATATVNATPGLKLRARYSAATLMCTATGTYLLVGDLSA
jgi:hypothetical protein